MTTRSSPRPRDPSHPDTAHSGDPVGVFSPGLRARTVGILASVGAVALESLGVATILPVVAEDLDGLAAYGWGLSALMLANIVGTVLAGGDIDRRGPARTVLVGGLVFAAGCIVAGAAPTWEVFIAARALQGLGVGAVMAYAYSLVGLAYPARLRPVMFAFLSSAWTIPSLVGPLLAGALVAVADWRLVFWVVGPIVLALLPLVLPSARRVGAVSSRGGPDSGAAAARSVDEARRARRGALVASIVLAVASAVLLASLESTSLLVLVPLVGIGGLVAAWSFRRLTPVGTLRGARGAAAGVGVRFLLCGAYFGSEAFVPLGLTRLHGVGVTLAGVALATGALTWTAGSFIQARIDAARPGTRARSVRWGFVVLLAGQVLTAVTVAVPDAWSGGAVLGWAIAGLGMGVAFNAATSATMSAGSSAGATSASLQLAQTLATALIAGAGGAVLAAAGTGPAGFAGVFAATGALALAGVFLAGRTDTRVASIPNERLAVRNDR